MPLTEDLIGYGEKSIFTPETAAPGAGRKGVRKQGERSGGRSRYEKRKEVQLKRERKEITWIKSMYITLEGDERRICFG